MKLGNIMINIIFPSMPSTRKLDIFWQKEAEAAKSVGFGISTVTDPNDSGPLFVSGGHSKAISLYRGWIVKPQYYQEMYQITGETLLTSYEDYMWTHNFPKWYEVLNNEETPKSITFTGNEIFSMGLAQIAEKVAEQIGSKSIMIKDYLKSRKHEWFDACFIKDASDIKDLIRVMTNFFNLQGRDFYGGLVFRDFIQLKKLGVHPKSGMPLPIEFRTFFLNQEPLVTSMYWDNDIPYPEGIESPPQAWLEEIGKKMKSPFVALDIAQAEDGKWWVIEVNDGGTAGYPDSLDSKEFYSLLYNRLTGQVQSS